MRRGCFMCSKVQLYDKVLEHLFMWDLSIQAAIAKSFSIF